MKDTIFAYKSYKSYLSDLIRSGPGKGRGMKRALAKAANCQSTYVSQVLNGDRHFNLEQAELINLHLAHSSEEARFFITLVSYERAGIDALKKRLEGELKIQIEKHEDLRERLKARKDELNKEIQSRYYRKWYYAAIHICLSISKLRRKEDISRMLGIPVTQVTEALEFLTSVGLAKRVGNEFHMGTENVFIGKDSPFLIHHHLNWRHQAIRSIELNDKDDFHYSSVISIPAKDAKKLRSLFIKIVEDAREIWKNSTHEEELHSICVDFFRVGRNL